MTPYCKILQNSGTVPYLWGTQVSQQLLNQKNKTFMKLGGKVQTSFRKKSPLTEAIVFPNSYQSYDAFKYDIAYLNIYFDEARAIEFHNQPSNSWSTYFATVGGIYGLCLGFSLATLFELIWLFINIVKELIHVIGLFLSTFIIK